VREVTDSACSCRLPIVIEEPAPPPTPLLLSLRKDTPRERPFRRVLVANRGEIAVRIIRACRELGMEAVAVYSDADASAPHVRMADAAVRLGPAPATESYLRIDSVVEAAVTSRAEAIHPGYGFLSERAPFADACAEAGIVFVGPSPQALAGLGDKLAARRAARGVSVAVVPGTLDPAPVGDAEGIAELARMADGIGWPLLIKAAAGGGGRGMRRVESADELAGALQAASAEALAAFGDGSVYLERYLTGGRHVEVQLLGDHHGRVVALGERDCSVQRRHQKLVEEAPAPGLSSAQREELHAAAVRVAQAVGLTNAATAEFLWMGDRAWFLEVNARLQVEHGVTELVTGLDLVHEQFWIASGRPLSDRVLTAAARAAEPEAHAIEARISAEDPGNAFAPAPGTVTRWREPGGPGVRVDAGVVAGQRIGVDYDPLLAKLLVVAVDRPGAIARLERSLREFSIGGVQTTIPFHLWLAAHPAFREAELATDLVDRLWDPEPLVRAAQERGAEAAAGAAGRDAGAGPLTTGTAPRGDGGASVTGARAVAAERRSAWSTTGRREATDRWRA
jgi:acetyl/propionyl-CoA carboxylase alpha subunit